MPTRRLSCAPTGGLWTWRDFEPTSRLLSALVSQWSSTPPSAVACSRPRTARPIQAGRSPLTRHFPNALGGGSGMKAARLYQYDPPFSGPQFLKLEDVGNPKLQDADDVIVRI